MSELLTRQEAADYLNVSTATLDRMIRDKELEAIKLRPDSHYRPLIRVPLASIEELLARSTTPKRRRRVRRTA